MVQRPQILGLILSAILLVSSVAFAQPGEGLRAGKLSLSPGLTVSAAFDSNLFYSSTEETEDIFAAPSLKITPFISMATVDADVVNFSLYGSVGWEQYLRPDESTVQDQSGLDANVDLGVGFNENGAVSLRLEDSFTRTNEPPYEASSASFDRTLNRAGATLGVHPGGRVFQHYLSYDFSLVLHDRIKDLNRQKHDFTLKNYWKFLPKTAVVLSGDYSLVRWNEDVRSRGGNDVPNVNSNPLRITGGLTGLITNKFSVRLIGGWGWGFYQTDPSFSGLIVDSRLTYAIGATSEDSSVYAGYERQFQDASIANFTTHHRPYIGYVQGIADKRLRLSAKLEFLLREYVGVPAGLYNVPAGQLNVPADLNDSLLRLKAGVDFDITKWFTTGLNYSLASNFTDDRVDGTGAAGDALREYTRHYVGLAFTLKY